MEEQLNLDIDSIARADAMSVTINQSWTAQDISESPYFGLHDDEDEKPFMVIDNGSAQMKAGFSGEDTPLRIPTVVGYDARKASLLSSDTKDYYIGHEAIHRQKKHGCYDLKYPLENGIVQNWEDMEKVWRHTFDNELRCVVGDEDEAEEDVAGVLMTEKPNTPKEDRERMTQIMFETFAARRFCVKNHAALAIYASGRTTGCVFDSGHGITHAVPIFEGYAVQYAVREHAEGATTIAGQDLTEYLRELLAESKSATWNPSICSKESRYRIYCSPEKIKEDLCYVSMDFYEEVDAFAGKEKQFEMPDGTIVAVHNQMIRCPELMFRPSLKGLLDYRGKSMMGCHEILKQSISDCPMAIRKEMLCNIVCNGGNTMFPNLPERLHAEVQGLMPKATYTKVIAPPERMLGTWIGGSILASLSTFRKSLIQHSSDTNTNTIGYEDVGPRIVHSMCW